MTTYSPTPQSLPPPACTDERLRAICAKTYPGEFQDAGGAGKRPLLLPSKIDDRITFMEKQWADPLQNKAAFQRGVQQI